MIVRGVNMEQSYELCKFYNAEQGCRNGKSCWYNPESPIRCWKFLYPYTICEHFNFAESAEIVD